MASNNYYPQQVGSLAPHDLWEQFKLAYDKIYALEAKIADLESQAGKSKPVAQAASGGTLNTTIAGILVKASTPNDGETIRFRKASGQFEFGA